MTKTEREELAQVIRRAQDGNLADRLIAVETAVLKLLSEKELK